MTEQTLTQLAELSKYLSSRREHILKAWHNAAKADPEQSTVDALTRSQFYDHIPQILDALEQKLAARTDGERKAAAIRQEKQDEVKHGLQRWQQGYRLREVMSELGNLHLCLTREVESFAVSRPDVTAQTITEAQCELITLVNNAMNESLAQYVRMEKDAAAGRARDLERAVAEIGEMERQRGALIREAVHDLGGSVQAVTTAATILSLSHLPDERRTAVAQTVERGVKGLRMMLRELMSLARLEAGEEKRKVSGFDAAELLTEFCAVSQTTAKERGLWLEATGPQTLEVEGDSDKVHRIVQNLVQNALKYTENGGVNVSWGRERTEQWWVMVKDTGPGLLGSHVAPRSAGEETDAVPHRDGIGMAAARQRPGEGIGLAIVKRLCDLLDASLEVASSAEEGTTFRVLLPICYKSVAQAE